jgi:hypothetical protein
VCFYFLGAAAGLAGAAGLAAAAGAAGFAGAAAALAGTFLLAIFKSSRAEKQKQKQSTRNVTHIYLF